MSLQGLPVAFLEVFSGQNKMTRLFGETLDIELKAKLDVFQNARNKTGGNLDIKFSSPRIQGQAALNISDVISLRDPNQPMTIKWTLTPNGFTSLHELIKTSLDHNFDDHLLLTEPSVINARLTSFKLPWLEKVQSSSL
jgi:hypothetical protein